MNSGILLLAFKFVTTLLPKRNSIRHHFCTKPSLQTSTDHWKQEKVGEVPSSSKSPRVSLRCLLVGHKTTVTALTAATYDWKECVISGTVLLDFLRCNVFSLCRWNPLHLESIRWEVNIFLVV